MFDELEREALHYGARVGTGTKWKNLTSEQRTGFDNYMRAKVRNHQALYSKDPRAKKYLKDYDQADFDAMRQQELRDSVDGSGGLWDGMGGGVIPNASNGGAEAEETQNNQDDRDNGDDEEEDTEEDDGKKKKGSDEDDNPEEEGSGPAKTKTEEDASKATGKAGEAGEAAEGAAGAEAGAAAGGEAVAAGATGAAGAEAAAAGAAAAGAGAVEAAVVVESNPVGWVLTIIAILVGLLIIFFILTALNVKYPSTEKTATGGKQTVICVDPGHPSERRESSTLEDYKKDEANWNSSKSGANAGTSGSGAEERVLNQQVADLLVAELNSRGYNAVETKNDSETYMSNRARGKFCKDASADMIAKVHNDDSSGFNGMTFWYPNKTLISQKSGIKNDENQYPYKTSDATYSKDITIRDSLLKAFQDGQKKYSYTYPSKIQDGSKNNNDGFGYTYDIPTTLLEMSAMGKSSTNFVKDPANQKKMAKAFADGIQNYMPPTSGGGSGNCQALLPGTSGMGFLQLPKNTTFNINGGSPSSQQWGSPELVSFLVSAADTWASKHASSKITIGDLSMKEGGKFGSHDSHRVGNDVDITSHGNPSFIMTDSHYDRALSIEFAKQLFDTKSIIYIFYNDTEVQRAVNDYAQKNHLPGKMESWPSHNNHFHVRIDTSAYAKNCGFTLSAGGKKS